MSDASLPPPSSATVSLSVDPGGYVLEVGDPSGMAISTRDAHESPTVRGSSTSLKRAVARSAKEPAPELSKSPAGPVETASQVTDKLEHTIRLVTEVAERRVDLKSLSDEADALLALLQRLDRHERWSDAVRVARTLATLLALLGRWLELLRSLRLALSLAERFRDDASKAWALHELGTLHLAAGRNADADRLLSDARETRARIGDKRGLRITDRNLLTLCHTLRASIHPPPRARWVVRVLQSPTLALLIALSLLLLGGAAGAVIDSSGSSPGPTPHPLTIDVTPASPHPGDTVSFHVSATVSADTYAWWFGDGSSRLSSHPRHVFKRSGAYRVIVTLADAHGAIKGSATRLLAVTPRSPPPRKIDGHGPTSKVPTGQVTAKTKSTKVVSVKITSTSVLVRSSKVNEVTTPTPEAESGKTEREQRALG